MVVKRLLALQFRFRISLCESTMDSAVLNYQELAKVHENFTFLHFQDVTIY